MNSISTISDLDSIEKIYPYCMRCEYTGDALVTNELKVLFGEHAPLELVKRCLVCKKCGKKDEIILSSISDEEMPSIEQIDL